MFQPSNSSVAAETSPLVRFPPTPDQTGKPPHAAVHVRLGFPAARHAGCTELICFLFPRRGRFPEQIRDPGVWVPWRPRSEVCLGTGRRQDHFSHTSVNGDSVSLPCGPSVDVQAIFRGGPPGAAHVRELRSRSHEASGAWRSEQPKCSVPAHVMTPEQRRSRYSWGRAERGEGGGRRGLASVGLPKRIALGYICVFAHRGCVSSKSLYRRKCESFSRIGQHMTRSGLMLAMLRMFGRNLGRC